MKGDEECDLKLLPRKERRERNRILQRKARNSELSSILILIVILSCYLKCGASAFESELFNQAVLALNTASSLSVDEFVFAAANLNFPATKARPPQKLFLPSPARLPFSLSLPRAPISMPNITISIPPNNFFQDTFYDDYETVSRSRALMLTPEEAELFRIVKEVREIYCPGTTVRVAGGWVRDKLLHTASTNSDTISSHDIDFVLSDISGTDFGKYFYQYVRQKEEDQKDHSSSSSSSSSSSLQQVFHTSSSQKQQQGKQPLSSQHLQTASLKFKSFWLDFANLRYERYADSNSRVPSKSGVASVVQDAWRRDLTINSLFYNLQTNQVEDWTEQGLQDLQLGVIATPFSPLTALVEDPLRVLRAVRFAAQFSFGMHPALKQAAMDLRVRQSLQQKVSKDRIGRELHMIFQTQDPCRGMELLLETRLIDQVFPLEVVSPPPTRSNNYYQVEEGETKTNDKRGKPDVDDSVYDVYKEGCQLLCRTQQFLSNDLRISHTQRYLLYYAAFLKPLHDNHYVNSNNNNNSREYNKTSRRKRKDQSFFYQLLTANLRRPLTDTQSIEQIIQGVDVLQSFLQEHYDEIRGAFLETNEGSPSLQNGNLASLRWRTYQVLKQVGPLWKNSLLLVLLSTFSSSSPFELSLNIHASYPTDGGDDKDCDSCSLQKNGMLQESYHQWLVWIEDRLQLTPAVLFDPKSCYAKNPILNGSQLLQHSATFPKLQPGKDFQRIMKAQEEWQVRRGLQMRGFERHHVHESSKLLERRVATKVGEQDSAPPPPQVFVDNDDEVSCLIEYLIEKFPEYR